jgi:hypothetical protein
MEALRAMSTLPVNPQDDNQTNPRSPFEQIKRTNPDGNEFWSARDLMPILEYTKWQNFSAVCEDVYSIFCLDNTLQTDMVRSMCEVEIGKGAIRKIEDWHLTRPVLEQLLNRVASHKLAAVRELRKLNESRIRVEIEIGAMLYDFCEEAGFSITHQKRIGKYVFDYCIAGQLLIEVDELGHRLRSRQIATDRCKDELAAHLGYKMLRVAIPVNNVARLCGQITHLL